MRLTPFERKTIQAVVKKFDEKADVFLYGSRTQDSLRGGDIDLLILSERLGFSDKIGILVKLKECLGEQKIDVLIKTGRDSRSDPFVAEIMKTAVPL